jgi:hypothetical protein
MKKKITLSALALVVMTASAFTVRNGNTAAPGSNASTLCSNGAFRDGLYLGKLTGESGDQYRVAAGRWARAEDRASFAAGYDQGYRGQVSIRAAK